MIATTPRAQAVLASWDATARTHALWSVAWDFVFMCTYGLWMSRLARYGGHRLASRSRIVSGWAGIAAGAAWVGVALDGVENVALLVVLLHSTAQPWPAIATVAASLKFFCLICCLFYGLTALLAAMMPEDEGLQVRPPRP